MAERLLRALTVMLVLGVAVLAFAVSFEAISAFAVATGAFPPALGWCAPLLVDTFTAAATLVIWSRSLAGLGAGYARTLVAAATVVSLALNVAHAPLMLPPGWWPRCRRWRCWPPTSWRSWWRRLASPTGTVTAIYQTGSPELATRWLRAVAPPITALVDPQPPDVQARVWAKVTEAWAPYTSADRPRPPGEPGAMGDRDPVGPRGLRSVPPAPRPRR